MFVLNARADDERRGRFREQVQESGRRPTRGERWIIFIHGFHCPRDRALCQAEHLESHTSLNFGDARAAYGIYLWPSSSRTRSTLGAFTYPATVSVAEKAGGILADYLFEQGCQDALLVGQSLGALVAMKTCQQWLTKRPAPDMFKDLLLTGAAVKVNEMERGGNFKNQMATREVVMHCPDDVVLRRVFGLGERAHALFDPKSKAVGLAGAPPDREWTRLETKVRHHRYWQEPVTGETLTYLLQRRPIDSRLRESVRMQSPAARMRGDCC